MLNSARCAGVCDGTRRECLHDTFKGHFAKNLTGMRLILHECALKVDRN